MTEERLPNLEELAAKAGVRLAARSGDGGGRLLLDLLLTESFSESHMVLQSFSPIQNALLDFGHGHFCDSHTFHMHCAVGSGG